MVFSGNSQGKWSARSRKIHFLPSELRRNLGRERFVKIVQVKSQTGSKKLGDGAVKTQGKDGSRDRDKEGTNQWVLRRIFCFSEC